MSNQKDCLTCKHKRCIDGVLYCIYSPKVMRNGELVNAKPEICSVVVKKENGKCFNYSNWTPKPEKSLFKNVLKDSKKILKKVKSEIIFLR